ncbi:MULTISPECIES: sugar phosphate isomerase/epimerase family protein [unclassified Luteococcus]|uniref:sugar phosphate isomerase/epimerase family protein n=1 Tax=unclassified Luteococcus TaxID=2639923 RepID=UPI00313C882C
MWTLTGFADEISDDFAEQLALLNTLGVKYLEFRSAWGQNILLLNQEQLATAKQMLDDAGIGVSSIGSPVGKQLITDPVDEHVAGMKHAVDLAHYFGARYIRGFSFFMPEGEDPDQYRDEVLRRMRLFVEIAEAGDVVLLHENEKDIYGDIPRRCLDLVTSIDSPHFKAIIDPANYVQCDVRPFDEAYPLMREHTVYMHMKDAVMGTPQVVPVGEGDGQVPEILHALHESGFDGFFSIEPHLGDYTAWGAMSGPELWTKAHTALVTLMDAEGVDHR